LFVSDEIADMPLMRASDDCYPENLVGVRFPMLDDSDRTKRVICLVTYSALHDRATFDGNGDDWMRAWLEHRGAIEALARGREIGGPCHSRPRVRRAILNASFIAS
jgi:Protein of unknown function (DUF1488)